MHIYQQEYDDGINEKIIANNSLAYITSAQPCLKKDIDIAKANINNDQAVAALNDDDLYYVQSILVTSSWNRNDDIFDKLEVWKAKSTPEDKPTNLEHDEDQIVGHIVSNWTIDADGNILSDDIELDALPEKFHIVTGSVIYKNFTNPELKQRADSLIEDIENGTKYVSMECYFSNFDYGLLDKSTGEYKILKRDNNSAYLTKHLRAYGGLGEYDNFKIGRVLREINFSGKGFVDRPANPESIIFDSEITKKVLNKNILLENNSVSNIQASLNMENTNMSVEKDIADLKDKVEAMNGCGEVLKEAYSRVSELEAKVMQLEATMHQEREDKTKKEEEMAAMMKKEEEMATVLAEKDKELEEYKSKMEYDVAQLDEAKATEIQEMTSAHEEALKSVQEELASANETIEAYKAQEAELARQALIASRISALVETGVTVEVAEATVKQFEGLDDEAFATITTLVGSNTPEWAQTKSEEVSEEAAAEEVEASTEEETESAVSEEILEDVETEENSVDLSVGSEDDSELETARASLVDFVYSRLGKEQSNKGE